MKGQPRPKEPLTPLDYTFMIGGPILFFVIAWFGVMSLLGPGPAENPVQKLRREVVKPGMTESQVIREVGEPKSIEETATGGYSFRYQRSGWDSDAKQAREEDAFVDFDANGRVVNITFDSRVPPTAAEIGEARKK